MTINLPFINIKTLIKLSLGIFFVSVVGLSIAASAHYKGNLFIYLVFSIISNTLLYFGFRSRAIFFDIFIGIFFWLGFWLKLTIRVAFTGGLFHEAVGGFDGSGEAFDKALLIASCGLSALIAAGYLREKYFFKYPKDSEGVSQGGFLSFYSRYRTAVLAGFAVLFLAVAVSNIYLGIYQRGAITQTVLPFGLNGVYKWLLLFGLASFSALIIKSELELKKTSLYWVVVLGLIESFVSNVALLSRGMVLNAGALLYGLFVSVKDKTVNSVIRLFMTASIVFVVLFGSSVYLVNTMRTGAFQEMLLELGGKGLRLDALDALRLDEANSMATPLFIDRWVGMEGVMAVSSYPNLGWDLWHKAWKEVYSENTTSFYDMELIESPYINTDKSKHHYISLPGIIAFCFYPGSYVFLFVIMLSLGLFAAALEYFVFLLGGKNLILCSLLAQVIAFRFASFGYVPTQSYLLLGTIMLNVLLIYFTDKALFKMQTHTSR